jgi:hypothetical protein
LGLRWFNPAPLAAGATIVREPVTQDYGDRDCTCKDGEGYLWHSAHTTRTREAAALFRLQVQNVLAADLDADAGLVLFLVKRIAEHRDHDDKRADEQIDKIVIHDIPKRGVRTWHDQKLVGRTGSDTPTHSSPDAYSHRQFTDASFVPGAAPSQDARDSPILTWTCDEEPS